MADKNITGRDDYIIAQAMAYAIAMIDSLPPDKRELGNRMAMVMLLHHYAPDAEFREMILDGIEGHTGRRPSV